MFIDIHNHILPGIDDGASTMDEALEMLEIAKNDGICGIAATPHIMAGVYENTKESINDDLSKLKKRVEGIALYEGAEIRISMGLLKKVDNNELPLINNQNYILLEFPAYGLPPVTELEKIVSYLKMKEITPIVSHPERNVVMVNNHTIMERLMNYGAIFQATAMSITENIHINVKESTLKMIEKGLIHVVASDAHDSVNRKPVLSEAYLKILKLFGEDEAARLFVLNPSRIVRGQEVDYCQRDNRKRSFINSFFKLFSFSSR
jgi:protein-tyrosine phosphatase